MAAAALSKHNAQPTMIYNGFPNIKEHRFFFKLAYDSGQIEED